MCGLAGIVGHEVSPETIEKALKTIEHRGPDGDGHYVTEDCTLLHKRLAIIDLSDTGHQPMADPETGVVVVQNGEIYNYRELRESLDGSFFGDSDTEVILRAYLQDGIECVSRLMGMFAIAIWDPRDQTLHLVRDRFGIKPLYIHHDSTGGLIFASEAKAAIALGAPSRPSLAVLNNYLAHGVFANDERTIFADIKSLPPATILTWHAGKTRQHTYWSPADTELAAMDGRDIEAEAWELMSASLRRHLVADVPVGVSLSSGLDSRLMLHLLAKIEPRTYHSYTFGFDEPEYDEIRRNEHVDFALPLNRRSLRTRPDDVLSDIESAIHFFECPLGGLGTLAAWRLMRLPREDNVPVLLSGEGADEAFGGYRYFYESYLRELYEAGDTSVFDRELAAYNAAFGKDLKPDTDTFKQRILSAGIDQRAPDGSSLSGRGFASAALMAAGAAEDQSHVVTQDFADKPPLRHRMLTDLTKLKIPKLLWFQDRASMAWGIETRVPFLDHPLIEFAYSLPPNWLIRDGAQKYLPKRLLHRFCNVDYRESQKLFVATPQREWLKGPLLEPILAYLDGGILASSGLIDFESFGDAYRDYASKPELGNSFFVWKILNLEAMMRTFFPDFSRDMIPSS